MLPFDALHAHEQPGMLQEYVFSAGAKYVACATCVVTRSERR